MLFLINVGTCIYSSAVQTTSSQLSNCHTKVSTVQLLEASSEQYGACTCTYSDYLSIIISTLLHHTHNVGSRAPSHPKALGSKVVHYICSRVQSRAQGTALGYSAPTMCLHACHVPTTHLSMKFLLLHPLKLKGIHRKPHDCKHKLLSLWENRENQSE